jgi:hypothetical protein
LAAGVGIFNVTTHFVSLCITKIVISQDESATAFGCNFLPQAVKYQCKVKVLVPSSKMLAQICDVSY